MSSGPPRKLSRRAVLRLETQLCVRTRALAARLNSRWLHFCSIRRSLRVSGLFPRAASSLHGHSFYGKLKCVRYFDMQLAFHERYRAGPIAAGALLEEGLRKAVLTYNTCEDVVIGVWECLEKELRNYPDFIKLEAKCACVRPRLVLFDPREIPGEERYFKHTYIVMRFRHGISLVLDLSGYQFGFEWFFYTLRGFEMEVLGRKENGEVLDAGNMIRQNTDIARKESGSMQMAAAEPLNFAFEN